MQINVYTYYNDFIFTLEHKTQDQTKHCLISVCVKISKHNKKQKTKDTNKTKNLKHTHTVFTKLYQPNQKNKSHKNSKINCKTAMAQLTLVYCDITTRNSIILINSIYFNIPAAQKIIEVVAHVRDNAGPDIIPKPDNCIQLV